MSGLVSLSLLTLSRNVPVPILTHPNIDCTKRKNIEQIGGGSLSGLVSLSLLTLSRIVPVSAGPRPAGVGSRAPRVCWSQVQSRRSPQ